MIKRFFSCLGVLSLVCFSFFYTDKAADIIKKNDPIMKTIVEVSEEYIEEATNAILVSNNIIPGNNGIRIDLDKSYEKMKRLGSYNRSLLVFTEIEPAISISNTYDRYVIKGNDAKNFVSIIIKLDTLDYIEQFLAIINDKNIIVTFFANKDLINSELTEKIIKANCKLELLDDNYSTKDIRSINKLLRSYNIALTFCYVEEDNNNILNNCNKLRMHTIKPTLTTSNSPYRTIKENITAGSIIKLGNTEIVIKELKSIINYIAQKGYGITSLNNLLEE